MRKIGAGFGWGELRVFFWGGGGWGWGEEVLACMEKTQCRVTFEDDYIWWLVWLGSGCKEQDIKDMRVKS